jgi:nitrogen fixation NifU-like protein
MDAESLYTGILVNSSRNTDYSGIPESPADYLKKTGDNPVCGDTITWYLKIRDNRIDDIRYEVSGCMISKASAALLAFLMDGKPTDHFTGFYSQLQCVTSPDSAEPDKNELKQNNWLALAQIKSYPARRKCVLLAWNTLNQLLDNHT